MIHRVGDVLRISCPFTPTVVTGLDEAYVSVRWPWWEIDPDADGVRWNGEVALGRADPDELYIADPAPPRPRRYLPGRYPGADHPRHRGSQVRTAAGDGLVAPPEPESARAARR
ncbi:hypothetical protein Vlu01_45440 [Micromonospora lutea]|uniref:Uncharacterized protein n=1 Tax=Micromonospora lutea TaxID=419825 RepID=A0ABQ4J1B3_9ACTN|nr:hypothetical protein Vlu01_45440 [Micromonospora lutea]